MFPPVSSSAGCQTGVASGGGLASWRGVKEKMRELMSGIPCTVRVGPLTASRSYLPPSIHSVRWAGAGGWSGVREKYCWLAGGWKLVLEQCERKTLLGWRLLELPNRVILVYAVVVA